MRIGFELFERGISVSAAGADYPVTYPEDVWKGFPSKRELAAELVALQTYAAPIASGEREVVYELPRPRFLDRYHEWFRLNLPYLRDANPSASDRLAPEALARIERTFRDGPPRNDVLSFAETSDDRAVVALTMGKDSLASLVIGRQMGCDLAAVSCFHPSLSDAFKVRIPQMEALGAHLGLPVHSVSDRVLELASAVSSGVPSTGLIWSMSVAVYCLLLLPFAHHYRARYLVLGNGFEFNYQTRPHRGGEPVEMSPLQSWTGTSTLDAWIGELTGGAVRVTSWIHSLHAIACHKLVHSVRPDVGLYQVSCRRSPAGDNPRWCQECSTCAENYLFLVAMGRDPATVGFTRTMLDERSSKLFPLAADGLDESDPYRHHAAMQELLGFRLARRHGDDSWPTRSVLERIADLDTAAWQACERLYLEPAETAAPLPMAGRSTAAARQLLSRA